MPDVARDVTGRWRTGGGCAAALAALGLSAALTACGEPAPRPPPPEPEPEPSLLTLPPLSSTPPTTREATLLPATRPLLERVANPAEPEFLDLYLDEGYGDVVVGPAESVVVRTLDGSTPPAVGAAPRRLVRFVHLADLQLCDDESPTRTAAFDNLAQTSAALRPHDAELCRIVHAAVRTINALHRADPIDFVILGGDNADSAQQNEVAWVMALLSGGDVHCDSGDDDDLDPAGDDGKDPFRSEGLLMPWYWVSGNHDVNVQGNFAVDDEQRGLALGSFSEFGTRDYAFRRRGAVRDGDFVVPDPARALLDGPALLTLVKDHDDGHGLAALNDVDVAHGKAFYDFDVGDALTFVVMDTNNVGGGASGTLRRSDVERFVFPALARAAAEGRKAVLVSHHALDSLTLDGGFFGSNVDDALLPDDWRAELSLYPNVILSMVAHTHAQRVVPQQTSAQTAFWEMMTASLADFPQQFRVVEIHDDDNGSLRIEGTPVDFAVDDDPVAALGRQKGVVDYVTGYTFFDGRGADTDRNVALIVGR
jgi:3',5'-cyclic AMP phosphodiesterase CpdA